MENACIVMFLRLIIPTLAQIETKYISGAK